MVIRRRTSRGRAGPSPFVIFALAWSLAACESAPDRTSTAAVRDSSGVQIVENTGPLWPEGEGWRLADSASLDIGTFEGEPEYQLYRAFSAIKLPDGRIVVANNGTHELRFYDSSGTFLSSAGREGEGPGEFRGLQFLHSYAGDSLLTYDFRNRRFSIFALDGSFVRSFTPAPMTGAVAFPTYVAPFTDGSILLGLESPTTAEKLKSGLRREPVVFLHCDRDGALIDTLGRHPGTEWFIQTQGDGAPSMGIIIGQRVMGLQAQSVAYQEGFYFGAGDSYEISYYNIEGVLKRLVRLRRPNRSVTADDIERYRQRRLESVDDENQRIMMERRLAAMPFPETLPAFDRFVVDSDGNLWVEEYRLPGDDKPRWTVFDREGQMLGVVEAPERFRIYEIGTDFVLGRWTDELDIEHIRLYRLEKT